MVSNYVILFGPICSTPFGLHDDNYVLKAMGFCEILQADDIAHNFTADGGEGSRVSSMY